MNDLHAFLWSDGYSVRVRLSDGRTAGFPFLSIPTGYPTAWHAARAWAEEAGAASQEERHDED